MATASVFSCLLTLTEVLGRYLEYVYHIGDCQDPPEISSVDLELLLGEWEQALSEDIRRAVLRGTDLGIDTPGGANLRLAYLAVKLLLRRIQLDLDKGTHHIGGFTPYLRAQRAAEDIVHFVQELDESHCHGFRIPTNAYTLISATPFLLRCSLRSGSPTQNTPLKIAKDTINTLRSHRRNFSWHLAANCLGNCGDMIEMIEAGINQSSPALPNIDQYPDIGVSVLDDLLTVFGDTFEMDL
ncbi:hypothetical protein FQN54_005661 [Arachnomyces sp. PD_36]|nr:hypothetical protein FQN54_005661 [Arachnomyces sp. PD_36]